MHYLPGIQAPASDSGGPNAFTNVDGFGLGWYSSVPGRYRIHDTPDEHHPHPRLEPAVYRNVLPPIHDLNLQSLCHAIESPIVFGHVRAVRPLAMVPSPYEELNIVELRRLSARLSRWQTAILFEQAVSSSCTTALSEVRLLLPCCALATSPR